MRVDRVAITEYGTLNLSSHSVSDSKLTWKSACETLLHTHAFFIINFAYRTCTSLVFDSTGFFWEDTMAVRGRPRKGGYQPIWMLYRATYGLYAYQVARKAGQKHSVAISEAVKYVREKIPAMPISETEVKRIVARWQSRKNRICLFVGEPGPEPRFTLGPGPDGKIRPLRIVHTVCVGPHPDYPRSNAAGDTPPKTAI